MDPLITNSIDPALLRVLEKRGETRDGPSRRKRSRVGETTVQKDEDLDVPNAEPAPDAPPHTLDDLA